MGVHLCARGAREKAERCLCAARRGLIWVYLASFDELTSSHAQPGVSREAEGEPSMWACRCMRALRALCVQEGWKGHAGDRGQCDVVHADPRVRRRRQCERTNRCKRADLPQNYVRPRNLHARDRHHTHTHTHIRHMHSAARSVRFTSFRRHNEQLCERTHDAQTHNAQKPIA